MTMTETDSSPPVVPTKHQEETSSLGVDYDWSMFPKAGTKDSQSNGQVEKDELVELDALLFKDSDFQPKKALKRCGEELERQTKCQKTSNPDAVEEKEDDITPSFSVDDGWDEMLVNVHQADPTDTSIEQPSSEQVLGIEPGFILTEEAAEAIAALLNTGEKFEEDEPVFSRYFTNEASSTEDPSKNSVVLKDSKAANHSTPTPTVTIESLDDVVAVIQTGNNNTEHEENDSFDDPLESFLRSREAPEFIVHSP